jgi:protein-tyrosine-phosphatase/DNA-binding transcriptional ArsR family regulator
MEADAAVRALAALGHESRLRVFRLLVRAGGAGVPAGDLAEELEIPASTLSFHLQHLAQVGLVRHERRGRSLIYALHAETLNELFWFLGEDCCQGRMELCAPPGARIDARMHEALEEPEEHPTVLFLCSRNSARSQIAEAILRAEMGERVRALSGGIHPEPIHPLTLRVLKEAGLPTSQLFAKDLGRFLGKVTIDYAIVVCEAANEHCPTICPFAPTLLYWPFPDPVSTEGSERGRLAAFREVRDAIGSRIRAWLRDDFPALEARRRSGALGMEAATAPRG